MDILEQHKPLSDRHGLEISNDEFECIRDTLNELRQFNLDIYKDKCVKRRIAIRVRATSCSSAAEYCDLLRRRDAEVDKLLKVLTIHVSQFFRNRSAFEKLRLEIIPYLFSIARQEGRPELHCWSVGGANGEEPYRLAMILADPFRDEMRQIPCRISGTDVDEETLRAAREACYVEERLLELPESYKDRYFREISGKFQLGEEIRNMVVFNQGDISHGNVYQGCDLILCRNMLIYFERQQQEMVLRNFAGILRPGGVLVLGKSESLFGECRRYFQTICPVERIYRVAAGM